MLSVLHQSDMWTIVAIHTRIQHYAVQRNNTYQFTTHELPLSIIIIPTFTRWYFFDNE